MSRARRAISDFIVGEDGIPVTVLLLTNLMAVIWPLLPGGYLVNGDHPCRFAEALYMADVLLLGQLNPFGWNPYLQTGLPMFTFGPTFFPMLVVSLTRYVLFFASPEVSYNLVFVSAYLTYVIAAYFFTRSLGMRAWGSFSFSFLLCFTFTPFPADVYFSLPNAALIVGVWPYALGVALAFLSNSRLISLSNKSKIRTFLEYAALSALSGLSNVLATFGLGFMSLAFVASDFLRRRELGRSLRLLGYVSLAAIIGLLLSSFYLALPFVYSEHYYKLWSDPPDTTTRNMILMSPLVMPFYKEYANKPGGWFLSSIYSSSYLTTWALGLVGILISLILWRQDGLFFIFLVLASMFGAAGGFGSFVPQYLRFLDFTRIAWIGLACVTVDSAAQLVSKRWRSLGVFVGVAMLAVAFVPQVADSTTFFWLVRSRNSGGPLEHANNAITWLSQRSEPSGAVYVEDTTFWDSPAEPMNQLWFGHAFGAAFMELGPRRVYGGFYGFWYKPYWNSWWDINWGAYKMDSPGLRELFAKYDVRYALVFSDALKQKLSDGRYFSKVYESGDFAVYEVVNYTESFAYLLSGGQVVTLEIRPDLFRFIVQDAQPGDRMIVKMGYMPHWKAMVWGSPLSCDPYDVAFMQIPLPSGDSEVTLTYQPLPADYLLRTMSFICWCLVVVTYLRKSNSIMPF